MKSGLIIRHVPHEGLAGFREPIEAAGYVLERIEVTDPRLATIDLAVPDLLILMGGPMGVYEHERYPWIREQMRRLVPRLARDRPTLGVCFGAQLMAAAMGAEVFRGPVKEIGFHPLEVHDTPGAAPLRHLSGVPVLHWHGDTFTLPEGAELLASSERYAHQAFGRGRNILGLQFHAEMGLDDRFEVWTEQWPADIAAAGTTVEQLRADHETIGPRVVEAGRAMISEWLTQLEG